MAEPSRYAYVDSSALVKRYVREAGSLAVRRLLRSFGVLSSVLLGVEIHSAIHRRRREQALSEAAARRILRRVASDGAAWQQIAVSAEILGEARQQLARSTLRTLDAIHLATAIIVRREGFAIPFATADRRQADAAQAAGLEIFWVGDGPAPGP